MSLAYIHIPGGRLGKDPKAISTKTGTPMTVSSMACDLGRDKDEPTTWFDLVAFKEMAEYLLVMRKSERVSVFGRLQSRTYNGRQSLSIIVEGLQSAHGTYQQAAPAGEPKAEGQGYAPPPARAPRKPAPLPQPPDDLDELEDDIPF